jgi:putative polyhydroxyalkanoate system protein
MPKYQVDIPHALAVDEAKRRISGATEKLQRDYGATCAWKGDTELTVSRKGLDARVTVEPSRVHVDLNLGFLLTPFAEKIKNGIAKQLSSILAATPGSADS